MYIRSELHAEDVRTHAGEAPAAPHELLQHLNTLLTTADADTSRFLALSYAVVELGTGTIRLARAGLSYPILRRATGRSELVRSTGMLAGLLPEATFETVTIALETGDTLLLYSDGVEHLLAKTADPARVAARPDEALTATPWFRRLEREGVPAALHELRELHANARAAKAVIDDLTILAITRVAD